MPRSKSSSCAHENTDCNCKNKSNLFERKVISDQAAAGSHTVAMSIVLLLLHTVLIFKLGGVSLGSFDLPEWLQPNQKVTAAAEQTLNDEVTVEAAASDPVPVPIQVPSFGGSGSFTAISSGGQIFGPCPLKHTSVSADVNDGIARVSVTQQFKNPYSSDIQAVYTFPLDEHCAVESMRMKVGKRVILGDIKPRAEAEALYKSAAAEGKTAALLEEERPNIFTQSVANIHVGEDVSVTLNYVTMLAFRDGDYTFTFPTVIGPRFMPGSPIVTHGTGTSSDTSAVPDASRISPPHPNHSMRCGRDLTMKINLNSAFPISGIKSKLHEISTANLGEKQSSVSLAPHDEIPNKDFVLSWHVGSMGIQKGVQAHRVGKDGYLSVTLMPPDRFSSESVIPKEFVFLVDCSGSQSGLPIEKCKDTLRYILDKMGPKDVLQILSFSDNVNKLFENPRAMSPINKQVAKRYIDKLSADGGTFMGPAVEEACKLPTVPGRLRIVTFMTDGYVGNDREVIGLVRKFRASSRWFCFGTGDGVNRFLIDGVAREGGGEADYVYLNSPSQQIAEKFWKKVSSPILTDLEIDFGGLKVEDVVPNVPCDVWSQRPLTFLARYSKPSSGTIKIKGYSGDKEFQEQLAVTLPAVKRENSVLSTLWARQKVEQLTDEDNAQLAEGHQAKFVYQITKLGLDHHLLTPYTSFVAVDDTLKHKVTCPSGKCSEPLRMYVEGANSQHLVSPLGVNVRFGQSNEVGYVNQTYMGIKRFYGNDMIGNFCQNIGQLIGKWISEWINGFFADVNKALMYCIETIALNPFIALRGVCNPTPNNLNQPLFFYIRSAIDLVYGVAGGFLLLTSIGKVRQVARGGNEHRVNVYQCAVISLLLMAGPWIYRILFQLSDILITRTFMPDFGAVRPIGDALSSAFKGGLMAGVGLVAHAFAPVIGGAAGGLALGIVGELVAFWGLIIYLCFGIVLACQLTYLLFLAVGQSFLFTLSVIAGPIALAGGGTGKLERASVTYVLIWVELILWLVSWVVLIIALRMMLFADFNPCGKIVFSMCTLQAMIMTPWAISLLRLSPMSKYLSMNPIRGLAAGISKTALVARKVFEGFSTPR